MLALTEEPFVIATGFVVFGVYSAMPEGVARSLAAKLLPAEAMASGQGMLGAAVGLSSLAAGVVGGVIWGAFGPSAAFLYGAAMMGIGLFVFVWLNGTRRGVY